MGSSVSSSHDSKCKNTSDHTSPTVAMQQSVTQKVIPTNGTQPLQSSFTPQQRPLKGILKNKCCVQQKVEKPVKIVELYVLRGNEWSVSRVREDEVDIRKKELKSDKTVKRTYTKPTHDQTFLHFQPF